MERFFQEPGIPKKSIRVGIVVAILFLVLAGSVFLYYHSPEEKVWLVCLVKKFTGLYCPGCGAGRACYSILHGHFYQAFRYNSLLIILLPFLGIYYVLCGVEWVVCGRERISRYIPQWIPYVVLIIVLLYGIVRNIHIYPFVLLAPTNISG